MPTNVNEHAEVAALAAEVQAVTDNSATLVYIDQGYTCANVAAHAQAARITLDVVKLAVAKCGFLLLPRHSVVRCSIAWMRRFRRLAKSYECLPESVRRRFSFPRLRVLDAQSGNQTLR